MGVATVGVSGAQATQWAAELRAVLAANTDPGDSWTVPEQHCAIEHETDRFREAILAARLLDAQTPDLRKMLAKLNVVELPVPAATVHAIHQLRLTTPAGPPA